LAEEQIKAKQKIEAEDHAMCISYGLIKGTDGYAACRLKLRTDREMKAEAQAAQQQYQQQMEQFQRQQQETQQQQFKAQQDADVAARWQGFSKSMQDAATWMQGKNPNQPTTTTNCLKTVTGFSCASQ
jgi:uridine kinase